MLAAQTCGPAGHYPSVAAGNQAPTDDSRRPCLSTGRGWKGISAKGRRQRGVA